MIVAMRRFVSTSVVLTLLLAACGDTVVDPSHVDVTPSFETGGTVTLRRQRAIWFDGQPSHIGFEPVLIRGDFKAMTDFVFIPESDDFLAVNRAGVVALFHLDVDRAIMRGSFQIPAIYTNGSCAPSIAIDPNFTKEKWFYVNYCIDERYNVIKRYTLSVDDFGEMLYTGTNVIALGEPKANAAKRVVGSMGFDPEGVMWVNVGDRGIDENGQLETSDLGKIVRIRPLETTSLTGYVPATDNAFTGDTSKSQIVYALGFSNPWKGAFDSSGRYWVADRGGAVQEINIVQRAGQNFGSPRSDGAICKQTSCGEFTRPLRTWDGASDHSYVLEDPLIKQSVPLRAAWVGSMYKSSPSDPYKGFLDGKVIYGDFYAGFVRAVSLDSNGTIIGDAHVGHVRLPVAWRQARDGYMYVGTMYESVDVSQMSPDDSQLRSQEKQAGFWRVVPLP